MEVSSRTFYVRSGTSIFISYYMPHSPAFYAAFSSLLRKLYNGHWVMGD